MLDNDCTDVREKFSLSGKLSGKPKEDGVQQKQEPKNVRLVSFYAEFPDDLLESLETESAKLK